MGVFELSIKQKEYLNIINYYLRLGKKNDMIKEEFSSQQDFSNYIDETRYTVDIIKHRNQRKQTVDVGQGNFTIKNHSNIRGYR